MWTVEKRIFFILYFVFASWLPKSQRSKVAKKIRYLFAKRICTLGKNVNIERKAYFTPRLKVGDNSGIGINSEIYGPVEIGENVLMGPEVVIYTNGHQFKDVNKTIMSQGFTEDEPVIIGNDCWIGRRVMVMPGVTIGNGSVIGAGAVVTRDIPPFSVAVGVPAKVIKSRKDNTDEKSSMHIK